MFHTKKQVNDIRNCHVGAGILLYKSSDREIIEEKIVIIKGKMLNAGTGKPVEYNIVEEE